MKKAKNGNKTDPCNNVSQSKRSGTVGQVDIRGCWQLAGNNSKGGCELQISPENVGSAMYRELFKGDRK